MTTISAQYYDGKTSKKKEITVEFLDNNTLEISGGGVYFKTTIDDVSFSKRVGNTPRILGFADGSECHSRENDKIDTILKQKKNSISFTHMFESKMRYVVISIALLILSVVFFLTIGSDIAAKNIAKIIPQSIENKISTSSLEALDKYLLKPSKLSSERKNEIQTLFSKITENETKYTLHFRRGVGINAFALPSGDIIITDELIEFSDGNDDMIYGILAHEKGHVVHKHGMQALIKASIVSAVITYFTGDVSSLVATLSASMLNAAHSRDFERAADAYAKTKMQQEGISPKHLAEFFIKSQKDYEHNVTHGYLASHPSDKERIDNLLAL
jgi:Zn-dependent protease with chaperone function